jgi:2'-5' RNA ligase
MRTFVAVDLDPKIKEYFSELIRHLSRKNADIRWVKKQDMHITLKFLGEVSDNRIQKTTQSIRKACEPLESFQISFRGTGFFPPQSRFPRVLWAGIEPSHGLVSLQNSIENELQKHGFPREKRQFHPHLTLGRVRSSKNIPFVLQELADHQKSDFGSMKVEKVTFFKSTLKPTGAEYDVLSDIKLK